MSKQTTKQITHEMYIIDKELGFVPGNLMWMPVDEQESAAEMKRLSLKTGSGIMLTPENIDANFDPTHAEYIKEILSRLV